MKLFKGPFVELFVALVLMLVLAPAVSADAPAAVKTTPLDEYVAKPDPAFAFDETPAKVVEETDYTARTYHMVSQEWLDPTKVDRTKWEHWIVVFEPKVVDHKEHALVFINGGSNRDGEAPGGDGALSRVAVLSKSIVVDVKQIPNQPLKFPDEKMDKYKERGRSEDEMISYAWDKFLLTKDPLWLPRLPMTKAVVRAMDMTQKLHPDIQHFFVCGGSKRGWTTWTVAAVDKRVSGIAPAVIDVLSVTESLDNHYKSYGFWAPAIGDYVEMDIVSRIHTPEFAELRKIVDPYSYIDRLTMPKFILNGGGDQFFPPDSWKFYFDDLKGEKYMRYIANTDHGLNIDAYFNLASFYTAIRTNTPRPSFAWKKNDDGSLEVTCETKPTKVTLWQATNPEGRDFRLEKIGKVYTSTPVAESSPGMYRADVKAPEKGWTAFFLEMEFPNPSFPHPFKFSTGVSIVPDTYPAAAK
ncbi:MAG: PhoPQ-activated pathogenicity [Candidatus Hydrogenedentes bacterium]|nr:PhoPQ-activated pathogenicity [Candidatus Hydrogenedentota bacterium]